MPGKKKTVEEIDDNWILINGEKVHKSEEAKRLNHYFNNWEVERLLTKYVKSGCVSIELRDEIMVHAEELIRQIIRTHNFGEIYGHDSASFGDLFQTAWAQIESVLYKFDYSPGHKRVFNMWCVSPDTMLMTNRGLRTMKDVVEDPLSGHKELECSVGDHHLHQAFHRDHFDEVYGLNGFNRVDAAIKKPVADVIRIKTQYGYELVCTPKHGIYTLGSSGPEWKIAAELKESDLVAIQYDQQEFGSNSDVSDIILEKRGSRFGRWDHGGALTEELMYIIGLFLAEGSYSYGKLVIYNIDDDVVEILVNNTLGLRFIHEPRWQRISLCNVRFIEFLQKLGLGGKTAGTKIIPARLLQTNKSLQAAMLRGMFGGDGHSSKNNGKIGITSTSKELIDQVRMLLLNFGILTIMVTDDRSTSVFNGVTRSRKASYQLIVPTAYSNEFYNRIGFQIDRKQLKRDSLNRSRKMIYGVAEKFQNLYEKFGVGSISKRSIESLLRASSFCTLEKVERLISNWDQWSSDPDYQFIQSRISEMTRLKNKIVWLPVSELLEDQSEVYEISVDSDCHSYIANGIVSHNSQVAKSVILAYIKKETRDRKNYAPYRNHFVARQSRATDLRFQRFLDEVREICQFSDTHLEIIDALEELYLEDERPHDGLVSKLIKRSGMSRSRVSGFFKYIKLRSFEFSDSPFNQEMKAMEPRRKKYTNNISDDD